MALLMLWTAHVLKAAAGDGDCRLFATTVSALLDGRAPEKVPIMAHLLGASIEVWRAEEYGLGASGPEEIDRPCDA